MNRIRVGDRVVTTYEGTVPRIGTIKELRRADRYQERRAAVTFDDGREAVYALKFLRPAPSSEKDGAA